MYKFYINKYYSIYNIYNNLLILIMTELSFIIFYSICILFIFICIYYIYVSKNYFKNNIFYTLLGIFISGSISFGYLLLKKITEYTKNKNKNKIFIGSKDHPILEELNISLDETKYNNKISEYFDQIKEYIIDLTESDLNINELTVKNINYKDYFANNILNNHKQKVLNDKYFELQNDYNQATERINEKITDKIKTFAGFIRQLNNKNNTKFYPPGNVSKIFESYDNIKKQIDSNRITNIFKPQMILIDTNDKFIIDVNKLSNSDYIQNNIKVFTILSETNLLPSGLIESLIDDIQYIGELYNKFQKLKQKKSKIPLSFKENKKIMNELKNEINEDNIFEKLNENYIIINLKVQTLLENYFNLISEKENLETEKNKYKDCYDCYDKIYDKFKEIFNNLVESERVTKELYATLQEEEKKLLIRIEELFNEKENIESNLQRNREINNSLFKSNEDYKEQINQLIEKNSQLDNEIKIKESQIIKLQEDKNSDLDSYNQEKIKLSDEITTLKTEKFTIENQLKLLEQEYNILKTKIKTQNEKISILVLELTQSNDSNIVLRDKINDIQGQLSLTEYRYNQLLEDKNKIEEYKTEIITLRKNNKLLTSEKEQLIKDNENTIIKLKEEYEIKYTELEKKYTSLEADYNLNEQIRLEKSNYESRIIELNNILEIKKEKEKDIIFFQKKYDELNQKNLSILQRLDEQKRLYLSEYNTLNENYNDIVEKFKNKIPNFLKINSLQQIMNPNINDNNIKSKIESMDKLNQEIENIEFEEYITDETIQDLIKEYNNIIEVEIKLTKLYIQIDTINNLFKELNFQSEYDDYYSNPPNIYNIIYSLIKDHYILLEKLSIISKRHNEFREQNKFKQEIINDAKKTKEEILKIDNEKIQLSNEIEKLNTTIQQKDIEIQSLYKLLEQLKNDLSNINETKKQECQIEINKIKNELSELIQKRLQLETENKILKDSNELFLKTLNKDINRTIKKNLKINTEFINEFTKIINNELNFSDTNINKSLEYTKIISNKINFIIEKLLNINTLYNEVQIENNNLKEENKDLKIQNKDLTVQLQTIQTDLNIFKKFNKESINIIITLNQKIQELLESVSKNIKIIDEKKYKISETNTNFQQIKEKVDSDIKSIKILIENLQNQKDSDNYNFDIDKLFTIVTNLNDYEIIPNISKFENEIIIEILKEYNENLEELNKLKLDTDEFINEITLVKAENEKLKQEIANLKKQYELKINEYDPNIIMNFIKGIFKNINPEFNLDNIMSIDKLKDNLQLTLENILLKHNELFKNIINKYDKDLLVIQKKNINKESIIRNLKLKIQNNKEKTNNIESKTNNIQLKEQNIKNNIINTREEINQLKTLNDQLTLTNTELNQNYEKLDQEKNTIEKKLLESQRINQELENRMSNKESELTELTKIKAQLQSKEQELAQLNETKEKLEKVEKELQSKEQELVQLNETKEKLEKVEQELRDLIQLKEQLLIKEQRLTKELTKKLEEIQQTKIILQTKNTELEQTNTKLQIKEQEYIELTQNYNELLINKKLLDKQNKELQEENEKIKNRISELESELEKIKPLIEQIQILSSELEKIKSDNILLLNQNGIYKEEIKNLTRELQRITELNKKLLESKESLELEIKQLTTEETKELNKTVKEIINNYLNENNIPIKETAPQNTFTILGDTLNEKAEIQQRLNENIIIISNLKKQIQTLTEYNINLDAETASKLAMGLIQIQLLEKEIESKNDEIKKQLSIIKDQTKSLEEKEQTIKILNETHKLEITQLQDQIKSQQKLITENTTQILSLQALITENTEKNKLLELQITELKQKNIELIQEKERFIIELQNKIENLNKQNIDNKNFINDILSNLLIVETDYKNLINDSNFKLENIDILNQQIKSLNELFNINENFILDENNKNKISKIIKEYKTVIVNILYNNHKLNKENIDLKNDSEQLTIIQEKSDKIILQSENILELNQKNIDLLDSLDLLELNTTIENTKLENFQNYINSFKGGLKIINENINDKSIDNKNIKLELEQKYNKILKINEKLNKQSEEIGKRIIKLQKKSNDQRNENRILNERIQKKVSENKKLIEKYIQQIKDLTTEKDKKIDDLTSEKNQQITLLEKRIDDLTSEKNQQIQELEKRIADLTNEQIKQKQEIEKRIADLTSEKDQQITLLEQNIINLTAEKNQQKQELEQKIDDLTADKDQQITLLEQNIINLTNEQVQQKQELEKRIAELTADKDQQKQELEKRIAELTADKDQQITLLEQNIAELTADKDQQKQELEKRINDLTADKDQQKQELENRIAYNDNQINLFKQIITKYKEDIEQQKQVLEQRISELDNQNIKLEERIVELTKEKDQKISDLAKKIEENTELIKKISTLTDTNEELLKKITELQNQILALTNNNTILIDEKKILIKTNQQLITENDKLKIELQNKDQELILLIEINKQLEKELQKAKDDLSYGEDIYYFIEKPQIKQPINNIKSTISIKNKKLDKFDEYLLNNPRI